MTNRAPDLDDGHLYLPSDIFPDEEDEDDDGDDDIVGHHEGSNADVTDADGTCSWKLATKLASFSFFDGRQNPTSPLANYNMSPAFSALFDGPMLHHGMERYPFGVSRMGATHQFVAGGVQRFRGQRGSGGTGVFLPRVARNYPAMHIAGQENSGEQEQQRYYRPVNGRVGVEEIVGGCKACHVNLHRTGSGEAPPIPALAHYGSSDVNLQKGVQNPHLSVKPNLSA